MGKTFLIVLLLFIALLTVSAPIAGAHTPPWEIPTYAYINVAPKTVGVNQSVFITAFLDKVMPYAAIDNDIRFKGFKITITKPDGKTEKKTWDVVWDTTSSVCMIYTPDQAGTYKVKFEFPGQTYTWPNEYLNDVFLPSSAETTFTVQQEPIEKIQPYPLPTEYWSRPIEGQNNAWACIASNFLDPLTYGAAYTYGSLRFQPDGLAPDSPHIMWTKPIQFGGVVGGSNTGIWGATFYTGLSYESRFNNPIILYGRLYCDLPHSNSGSGGGYVCIDLRTGEEIWRRNYTVNPSFGQLLWFDTPNQHGVIPNGYLWATVADISGWSTWIAYDPWDGSWLFNYTKVPWGYGFWGVMSPPKVTTWRTYGPNGEILIYVLNTTGRWLALWNSTAPIGTRSIPGTYSWQYLWRPLGKVIDTSDAYSWNVTIPKLPTDSVILYPIYNDLIIGGAHFRKDVFGQYQFGGIGIDISYATIWTLSLKQESRGNLLWIKNYTAPPGNITVQFGPVDPVSRVFFMSHKETMQWEGYDLDKSNKLWGPVGKTRDINFYPASVGMGFSGQIGFVAYGKLYTAGYGGELFCYDSRTGTLLWKYNNTDSGLETPWGLYPLFIGSIADGKVYIYSNEHSPNAPLYKGYKVRCINASTGEELWTLLGWAGVGSFADCGWPVADGYLVYFNSYDGQLYCLGRGPTATTVEVSPATVSTGSYVVIRGSVIDISPGTKQHEQAARFPNGVPAVADECMGPWMEYVYMQKPMPANAKGVWVKLDAVNV
ncbi:MAG: PQQ-binding-like beta-propeller repeat protein, partial [Candidatus Bathyarchaeia archaeon]